MYLAHFGFSEAPFRITPHTDFFFAGANRGATLEALLYTITHDEGIVKVSGEVGSGKTMLCRVLMERLPENVETIYLANPSLARDEILIAIADELKLDLGSERSSRVLRSLQEALIGLYSQGRRVVVLIDEAHAMPRETLEEIRLLSNLEANRNKLLQIVLFGQPELDAHLNTAGMRQLKERITHSFRLDPLLRDDIASYIEFRLRAAGYRGPNPFTAAAIKMIDQASQGLTRRINILADKALLAAFAGNSHAVSAREVKRAVADSEFYRAPRRAAPLALGAAAGITVLAAGIGIGWFGFQLQDGARPARAAAPAVAPAEAPAAPETPQHTAEPTAGPTVETPAPLSPTVSKPIASSAVAVAEPAKRAADAASGPALPAGGKFVQERFLATQAWLEQAPKGHYAIQLLIVKDAEVGRLEKFLRRAAEHVPEAELRVYSVKIDGVQHYRAAYGSYSDVPAVLSAMSELPPLLKAQKPFHRSVQRMRSQNRQ